MKKQFREALEDSPVIAAIKDDAGLDKCAQCDSQIIFILYGDVITICDIVEKVKSYGKLAFVHMDLVQGLGNREVAVDFIAKNTKADGIISTKAALVTRARELGLSTVMRFFVIDSMAYKNIERQITQVRPDVIEVLPGPMPTVIGRMSDMFSQPMIASGLISDKDEVYSILDAGATSISTTNQDVWFL